MWTLLVFIRNTGLLLLFKLIDSGAMRHTISLIVRSECVPPNCDGLLLLKALMRTAEHLIHWSEEHCPVNPWKKLS